MSVRGSLLSWGLIMALSAVLVLGGLGLAQAQAQAPTKIAVIDMGKVTDNYKALQDKSKALNVWLQGKQKYIEGLQDFMFLAADSFNEVVDLLKADTLSADKQKRLEELRKLASDKEKQFLDLRSKTGRTAAEDDSYKALGDLYTASQQRVTALQSELQNNYNQQVGDAREGFMKTVQETAKAMAKTEGYDLVLDSSMVLVGGVDITDKIIAQLNAAPAAGGAH